MKPPRLLPRGLCAACGEFRVLALGCCGACHQRAKDVAHRLLDPPPPPRPFSLTEVNQVLKDLYAPAVKRMMDQQSAILRQLNADLFTDGAKSLPLTIDVKTARGRRGFRTP